VHESTERDRTPALSKASSADLVDVLAHPNGWWRDTAQRILVERGDRGVKLLAERAVQAPDWRTRLHAMWTLDGLDSLEPVDRRAGARPRRARRAHERPQARGALARRGGPSDTGRCAEAARRSGLGGPAPARGDAGGVPAGAPAKIGAITTLLERHADDPITLDAALSGIAGSERAVLTRLLQADAPTPQRNAAAVLLTATMIRGGESAAIQELLAIGSEPNRPDWQVDALLSGAEAALLDAPLPGSGRRGAGRGAAAASTAPGGRAGPGGAPAFPKTDPAAPAPTPAGRGRAAMAAIPLAREPTPLIDLVDGGGPYAPRAEALLARLTWPGKAAAPGDAPAAAPLTTEEQQRFDAGRTVYNNLCMACHQDDGRGREKVAATLIGSPYALGPPEIGVRVLVNGKEGATGLMPPLGAVLGDDQIAAVLTYVRRSWGHQASAVDPATVAEARRAAADRTRPWTESELAPLLEP
jgi:mono/diheme cytochrome c family protein